MQESTFNMAEYTVTLDKIGETFEIIPIGDVHRETDNCDTERWKAFLKHLKKDLKKSTVLIGTGDWNDFAAWGDRRKIRNANLHESTVNELDRSALNHCTQMLDELWFAKDNFAGLIQGNHRWEWSFGDLAGKSSDDYYAERLNCPNLGELGYIRIHVKYKNTNKSHIVDVVMHHGKAGGKLAGSTINQVDDLRAIFPDADVYIMGHDHRKVAVPVTVLKVHCRYKGKGLMVKQKRQWLTRSGAFLRGYVEKKANYIVRALLRPTDLGIIKILCRGNRDNTGGKDIVTSDIHVWY